ncbi:ribonuclease HII [Alteromonadaceae bacterium A_SAG4]|nr:ribonuclease HII [Alteromonadaceae bacterium A_SAG4]NKX04071.1 ribonuclease HII [Alteromonadaceae bacterium A_SAG6]NKX34131.1 ribonuclease HII [Alteromonadaceae bacterium A_SAG3]
MLIKQQQKLSWRNCLHKLIAGVDEVGRGPLVGDVVTAAVILDPENPIEGLTDSKKLSEKKRVAIAQEIREKALYWNIGRASPEEIDKLNILHATMLAMIRAVEGLPVKPDFVRVDGNRVPAWNFESEAVVKGDSLHAEISAASIIAKVERDNDMISLHEAYPQYNFAGHKGYPTKAHFEAIAEYGILDCYRKSFKPVKALLEEK